MRVRSVLVRAGIAVVVLGVLGVLWLNESRHAVTLLDRIHTVPVATLPSNPVGWNGTFLQFGAAVEGMIGPQGWNGPDLLVGGHILDLDGPAPSPASLTVDDQNRLVISVHSGGRMILGTRVGTLPGADTPIPAYAAEPGDVTAMTIDHSWLSWPTFFDFHFGYLDGPSSTWHRNFYYRLSWKKRSGEQLEMLWRLKQGYDAANGWTAAGGSDDGATGLVSAQIRQPNP
jgi:hypothetical protein